MKVKLRMGKCRFKSDWLQKIDCNGYKISSWAQKFSDAELFCKVCDTKVTVSKGLQSVTQHAASNKHRTNSRIKLAPLQLKLCTVNVECNEVPATSASLSRASTIPVDSLPSPGGSLLCSSPSLPRPEGIITVYSVKDAATTAELIWVMKSVICNFSAASSQGISETFTAMFRDSVPQGFSLSPAKMGYIVSDALGPYFRIKLIEDLQQSFYTLMYDETTNHSGRKELQTSVRFWSEKTNEIETQHLETFFLGQATGEDLFKHICLAMDNANLSRQKLIMLGSDGPNVNLKVTRMMNEELILLRKKALVDIGTCNLHVIHNAFLKGLQELGDETSELVLNLYYFFKGWPTRKEDFAKVQDKLLLPKNHFIKHVMSRWLSLENAATRVLQQWDGIIEYFLKHVPMKRASLITSTKYKIISRLIKHPSMKAELHFVISSAQVFTKFTGMFQREEPLIHILQSELKTLAQTLLLRVVRKEAFEKNCDFDEEIFCSENMLPLKEVELGESANLLLQLGKLSERDQLHFRKLAQAHYIAACKHILRKTRISTNHLLSHFTCFQPEMRKTKSSCQDIIEIAKALPIDVPYDILLDEWKLLQLQKDPPESGTGRIDHFWRQYFPKFPTVATVIKASLSLAHGSADVERGFSLSSRVLTEDKASTCVRTLNAKLNIINSLKKYGNKPELVPITNKLLSLARCARQNYHNYLEGMKKAEHEKERKKKEEEEEKTLNEDRKRKLLEENNDIKRLDSCLAKVRKEECAKRKTSNKLLEEASDRLKKAMKSKDMAEVQLVQAMLEGVKTVRNELEDDIKEADIISKKLDKKKASLITEFFSKKN